MSRVRHRSSNTRWIPERRTVQSPPAVIVYRALQDDPKLESRPNARAGCLKNCWIRGSGWPSGRPFRIGAFRALLPMALAIYAVSCAKPPQKHNVAVGWRAVVSFEGSGPSQTESFNIDSGEWRIKWSARSRKSSEPEMLKITVHSAVSGRPLMVAVNRRGAGHDVAYVNEDPRLYHLVIDSTGVDWSLKIEEAVAGY